MANKQTMVEAVATKYKLGGTSTEALQAIFPQSPIYLEQLTDENITKDFQADVLDAVINDKGHTFGTFNTGYVDAPDLEDVEAALGSGIATPYLPNPTSPGEGSMNVTDQAAAPDGYGRNPSSQWGSGTGHVLQPKTSSEKIAGQKMGDYIKGHAYAE